MDIDCRPLLWAAFHLKEADSYNLFKFYCQIFSRDAMVADAKALTVARGRKGGREIITYSKRRNGCRCYLLNYF